MDTMCKLKLNMLEMSEKFRADLMNVVRSSVAPDSKYISLQSLDIIVSQQAHIVMQRAVSVLSVSMMKTLNPSKAENSTAEGHDHDLDLENALDAAFNDDVSDVHPLTNSNDDDQLKNDDADKAVQVPVEGVKAGQKMLEDKKHGAEAVEPDKEAGQKKRRAEAVEADKEAGQKKHEAEAVEPDKEAGQKKHGAEAVEPDKEAGQKKNKDKDKKHKDKDKKHKEKDKKHRDNTGGRGGRLAM